jgi:hypothetical protein
MTAKTTQTDETDDPADPDPTRVESKTRAEIRSMPRQRLIADLARHPDLSLEYTDDGEPDAVTFTKTPPLALDYTLGRSGWVVLAPDSDGRSRVSIGA